MLRVRYPIATAQIHEIFPFDLAFSMTVHKAQGRTIPRVIVDLTSRPTHLSQMKFAAIFVAMSRVKNKQHIRLLTHKLPGLKLNATQNYSYITSLQPSEHVIAFYHGYSPETATQTGTSWLPQAALQYSSSS